MNDRNDWLMIWVNFLILNLIEKMFVYVENGDILSISHIEDTYGLI